MSSLTSAQVSAADAASIALAVAREAARRRDRGELISIPGRAALRLHADGRVTWPEHGVQHTDDVRAIAELMSELLGLERDAAPPGGVPGPLMVTIARALGTIDLPAPTLHQLLDTLARYGSADTICLRNTYLRLRRSTAQEIGGESRQLLPALRWSAQTLAGTVAGFALALLVVREGWVSLDKTPTEPSRRTSTLAPRHQAATVVHDPFETVPPLHPIPLGGGDAAFSPSFAANGHQVLFHVGRRAAPIVQASLTGDGRIAEATAVVNDGSANYHAVLSPDGRWLAFDSDREGVRAVYVMPANGGPATRVSGNRAASVPSWAPDGKRVAYVEREPRNARVSQIWIADLGTGGRRQVTHHSFGTPWSASWFPDGRRIAYSREDRLVITALDHPSDTREYRAPVSGRLVRTPAVSPDGRRIVFQVLRDGVWMLDVEHETVTRILNDGSAEEFAWLPGGDVIAYHTRHGNSWSLWAVRVG